MADEQKLPRDLLKTAAFVFAVHGVDVAKQLKDTSTEELKTLLKHVENFRYNPIPPFPEMVSGYEHLSPFEKKIVRMASDLGNNKKSVAAAASAAAADADELYEVDFLTRISDDGKRFLVAWKNYPVNAWTCKPIQECVRECKKSVDDFLALAKSPVEIRIKYKAKLDDKKFTIVTVDQQSFWAAVLTCASLYDKKIETPSPQADADWIKAGRALVQGGNGYMYSLCAGVSEYYPVAFPGQGFFKWYPAVKGL